jgi:hypothetical protein
MSVVVTVYICLFVVSAFTLGWAASELHHIGKELRKLDQTLSELRRERR